MNHYGKQQCLDMDWSNVKEITTLELAWCIYEYNLDIDRVPDTRLRAVTNALLKIKQKQEQNKERELIESELEILGHTDDVTHTDKVIGYWLDPDLFGTYWEATMATSELNSCINHEMMKTEEYNYKYKDTNNYTRDMTRYKKSIDKARKQYIQLGGSETDFNKCVEQIPIPNKVTLKQDIDAKRKSIKERFISEGVPPTRANKIAITITTEAYKMLK